MFRWSSISINSSTGFDEQDMLCPRAASVFRRDKWGQLEAFTVLFMQELVSSAQ
jgi:hypothetical protein